MKKNQEIEITNVMRLLTTKHISFIPREYPVDEQDLSGIHAAELLGESPERLFKTLVAMGVKEHYYVFCIPVAEELDLKKVAKVAGEKKIEMLPMKELQPLTGYIRGGCSPLGMKKHFPTFLHESCLSQEMIGVSAGKRGLQVMLSPKDLLTLTGGKTADLIQKP